MQPTPQNVFRLNIIVLAPVVEKVDSAIRWINTYLVDSDLTQ